jgi:hypothetical protein
LGKVKVDCKSLGTVFNCSCSIAFKICIVEILNITLQEEAKGVFSIPNPNPQKIKVSKYHNPLTKLSLMLLLSTTGSTHRERHRERERERERKSQVWFSHLIPSLQYQNQGK